MYANSYIDLTDMAEFRIDTIDGTLDQATLRFSEPDNNGVYSAVTLTAWQLRELRDLIDGYLAADHEREVCELAANPGPF